MPTNNGNGHEAKVPLDAYIQVTLLIGDVIKDLGQIPSGHLYAFVMSHLSLRAYESIIGTLVGSKQIEKRGDLLVWKGDRKQ